jgi:hypothetical protein
MVVRDPDAGTFAPVESLPLPHPELLITFPELLITFLPFQLKLFEASGPFLFDFPGEDIFPDPIPLFESIAGDIFYMVLIPVIAADQEDQTRKYSTYKLCHSSRFLQVRKKCLKGRRVKKADPRA